MKLAVLTSLVGLGASLTVGQETESSFIAGRLSQTKHFELNLTWESWAPDGVARKQFLINGQFPGPPLIMDEGDNVEVTVNNFSPFNTTIHYHGIEKERRGQMVCLEFHRGRFCLVNGLSPNSLSSSMALTINNGGRYSCLVQLNKAPGKYPMTVANAGFNQKIAGFGTLSYTHTHGRSVVSTPSINYGGLATSTDVITLDETVIEMFTPSQPSEHSDKTYILTAGRIEKAWEWSLNGNHSYGLTLEAEKPVLWDPQSAAKSPLAIATKNNTWVDIIFILSGNTSTLQPGHPLHKHSNRAYILGTGTGDFNYTSVADAVKAIPDSFNLINPPMRDTFTTLPAYQGKSWMAIRYHVQNPGAFLLHCHLDPHLTGGMGLAILDGIDAWPTIPSQYGPNGKWGIIDP
ncbi:uncharacterized protein N7518_009445 [Penicillium psychrosexuale]|uniref:uncharacterized protein n=1 Tax=Penicillium psychrosexuale TaxID=1002107 RepID=UPI002545918C|nr:uncharacterized protein N7518_009445 [Penicillium psychrosexuale]KAJ5783768.1 hypothetical protein N7518_009445 [Penicillium psychrosexuale]